VSRTIEKKLIKLFKLFDSNENSETMSMIKEYRKIISIYSVTIWIGNNLEINI